jgi:hypothetical protein
MGTNGSVLRGVDVFSPWFIPRTSDSFDEQIPSCYKGVEIEVNSGNVHDSEIRHGIAQLHFALPSIVATRIKGLTAEHPTDNLPFFFSAILVTNAPLVVARKRLSHAAVAQADDVSDLGRTVPYVSLHVETGPEFERHLAAQFRDLPLLLKHQEFQVVEQRRRRAGAKGWQLPSGTAALLAAGTGWIGLNASFNHVIVCNATAFGKLVRRLLSEVDRVSNDLKKRPPFA